MAKIPIDALSLAPALRAEIDRWLCGETYAVEREGLQATALAALDGDASALAELEDAFAGSLPIGTGGRRGRCAAGPNRMNRVVLRETARGVILALREAGDTERVAVVHDTRHHSREFAYLVASEFAGSGLEVILVDAPRSTPLLSFLVRLRGCGAGVVISASHNPPEDNGIKIYGPDGAQVLGERDRRLMGCIERAMAEPRRVPAAETSALARWELPSGVEVLGEGSPGLHALDASYEAHILAQGVVPGSLAPSGLRVSFSPLHGVGHHAVLPVLRARGVEVSPVREQCDPDGGRFSTVESANPELAVSMARAVTLAREVGADLVMATDPDADRLGACVRDAEGEYRFVGGNRLGVLLLDHVLSCLAERGALDPSGWVLTTLVTSPLIAELARAHGVTVIDDLLVGFKHHAGMMAESSRPLIFACEESHGYLRGQEIRDKDGAIAALLLAECAAVEKSRGRTLLDRLETIWAARGYFRERTENLYAPGAAGREAIDALMAAWRGAPPPRLGGLRLAGATDRQEPRHTGSPTRDLSGNVLVFEYSTDGAGCRVVLRPSGTEPKVKIYALARGRDREGVDAMVDEVLRAAARDARAVMETPAGGAERRG